jgi:hypothetical protein
LTKRIDKTKKIFPNLFVKGFFIVHLLLLINPGLSAQWTSDPSFNFQVCNATGVQALPIVVSISDKDNLSDFTYLIDPSGNFSWETNGVRLSGTGDFQPNPVATQTSDGNFVFARIIESDGSQIKIIFFAEGIL